VPASPSGVGGGAVPGGVTAPVGTLPSSSAGVTAAAGVAGGFVVQQIVHADYATAPGGGAAASDGSGGGAAAGGDGAPGSAPSAARSGDWQAAQVHSSHYYLCHGRVLPACAGHHHDDRRDDPRVAVVAQTDGMLRGGGVVPRGLPGPGGASAIPSSSEVSAFVGDLPFDVVDDVLYRTFATRFSTIVRCGDAQRDAVSPHCVCVPAIAVALPAHSTRRRLQAALRRSIAPLCRSASLCRHRHCAGLGCVLRWVVCCVGLC
jgi:hypothetical protein